MTAEEINKYIKHFKPLYKNGIEINPMPDNVKLTAYCDNGDVVSGFAENVTVSEMGLNALIVKAWIEHAELKSLINQNNQP